MTWERSQTSESLLTGTYQSVWLCLFMCSNIHNITLWLHYVCVFFRYPEARAIQRKVIFHAGPTNSGKTYHAIQRYLGAKSGVYCGPLKLLAHEIFEKSNIAVRVYLLSFDRLGDNHYTSFKKSSIWETNVFNLNVYYMYVCVCVFFFKDVIVHLFLTTPYCWLLYFQGVPCDLVTGEERTFMDPDGRVSGHVACTIEMCSVNTPCK